LEQQIVNDPVIVPSFTGFKSDEIFISTSGYTSIMSDDNDSVASNVSRSLKTISDAIITTFKQQNNDIIEFVNIYGTKDFLSTEQVRELKSVASKKKHHIKMLRVLLETGITIDELVNLRYQNLSMSRCELTIRGETPTDDENGIIHRRDYSTRSIKISDSTMDMLSVDGDQPNAYVFASRNGAPFRKETIIYMVDTYAKKCETIGKKIGTRILRRTYSFNEILAKSPLINVSRNLGHKDVITTILFCFDARLISATRIIEKTTQPVGGLTS